MIYCAEESVQTVRRLTIGRGGALLLIQHQLLHLFPQVLLVDARRVKGVAHKLGHPGARRHLFLFFLRWLGVTQTGQKKGDSLLSFIVQQLLENTPTHSVFLLTFCTLAMETGGVFGLTWSTKK